MKEKTRSFRKQMTPEENRMWFFLRNRRLGGHKFNREFAIDFYIVDFICRSKNLIIEIDGSQHANQTEYDHKRNNFLISKGFRVIRFWNNDIQSNIDGVLQTILIELERN